jgi:rhamnulokinase
VAVDVGASSGRVVIARVGPAELQLTEVHRFPNEPVQLPDGLYWDVLSLFREILEGLRLAARTADDIVSVGIDTWGVDYGLLDADGRLLGNPHHYRDGRTARGVATVHAAVPPDQLYGRTGVQFLPLNTIYQLAASVGTAELDGAATMLLMPDLFGYWLSGNRVSEATNASTTGLLDVESGAWISDLAEAVGIPAGILAPIRPPGENLGRLRETLSGITGLPGSVELTLTGSHDTASAVVAVPADPGAAWISCGTWALVGLELDTPIRTEASRLANFTNEGGVDGRIRFLRNVTGLWLLQESIRTWELAGHPVDLAALLAAAAALPSGGPVIDPNDPVFFPPGDMPLRIAAGDSRLDGREPAGRDAIVRCFLDSLAAAFADTVADAVRLSGRPVSVIHVVGGGSQNTLLCQLTAVAAGLPVVAGPVEATAIGNALVQARAHGLIDGDLDALRALVRETQPLQRYEPRRRPSPSVA